jgi:FRG domain
LIEKKIKSIQDLLVELEQDNQNYSGSIWYRGQANTRWELIPGYLRLQNPPSESTLIKRFKQSAAMLVNSIPKESFDWLFLMQHYGVPTRLLDWSESPLVALYFAVESHEKHITTDATLWSLRPSELNKNAGINNAEEEFFVPSFEDIELQNYTVETLSQNARTQLRPLATIATRNNARIQAQHGVFTIHHHEKTPIENVGDSSHIIKYIIPDNSKKFILKQLSLLGFTKFQLFPELASIGDIIKGDLS